MAKPPICPKLYRVGEGLPINIQKTKINCRCTSLSRSVTILVCVSFQVNDSLVLGEIGIVLRAHYNREEVEGNMHWLWPRRVSIGASDVAVTLSLGH